MRKALVLAVTLVAGPCVGSAEDLARGRQLFQLCGACHGPTGLGHRGLSAPALAGLPAWYVSVQLEKFKRGARGHRVEDTAALQMRPMARALTSEGDVNAVAAHVAGLAPVRLATTVTGDIARGKTAYGTCGACHGEAGLGNQALGAPPLAHQSDWYLVAQLEKFRLGWRGTHPQDRAGAMMRPLALALPDERAVRDVVAYITTLGRAVAWPR